MAITMPKIDITFEQRAVSLIGRSERGVAILIVRDDTDKTFTHKQYSDLSAAQADESLYHRRQLCCHLRHARLCAVSGACVPL